MGKNQSIKLSERLKNLNITELITSDLLRAIETSKEIIKYHSNIKYSENKLLRERDLGDFEGIDYRIYFSKFKEENNSLTRNLQTANGSESLNQVFQRAIRILNILIKEYINQNIFIEIKNENIELNKDISYEELCEDFKQGKLSLNIKEDDIKLCNIVLISHCVLVKEFLNIFLIFLEKKILRWIEFSNTAIYIVKLFCGKCKGKCEKINEHNINDLIFSIDTINDFSHLN
jgi:hypothetical protein